MQLKILLLFLHYETNTSNNIIGTKCHYLVTYIHYQSTTYIIVLFIGIKQTDFYKDQVIVYQNTRRISHHL